MAHAPDSYLGCCDQYDGEGEECQEVEDEGFCYLELTVEDIDEIDDMQVNLEIYFPSDGVLRRGTIILGSAGGGTAFFSDSIVDDVECDDRGVAFMLQLAAIGFVVIDRQWPVTGGWTGMSNDPVPSRAEAARYATLLQYLYEHYHCPEDEGAFVAAGLSGGSSEVGFALSTYGMED